MPGLLSKMPGISPREVRRDTNVVDGACLLSVLCDGLALESKQQLI